MVDSLRRKKKVKLDNKNINKLIKRILKYILFVVIILLTIYLIYNGIQNSKTKNATKLLDEVKVYKEETIKEVATPERVLKVRELKKINVDIIGWLEIENTDISYPVLQGDDNEFYMTHDYKKEYTKNGSIFLDVKYDFTKPSTNLLMYGHNNNNNLMFAGLLKYKQKSYFDEHPVIRFTTDKEDAKYEIIAIFLSKVYYVTDTNVFRYYYFIDAESKKEYDEYVTNSKKASIYDTGNSATYGEQLLTLSTCSYHTEGGRFAIVARKVK